MVFADLVGSTEMAAGLDPEDVRGRLEPFFEVARETLSEHGGTLEKYIGDAVLAVFGVPVAHGDDPDRAVSAALSLLERVEALGTGLALRVGIETGEVLAADSDGDLSVTGEAVNAAARLQQAAAPGEVLVGERAGRSCRRVLLEPGPTVEAKGLDRPLATLRAAGMNGQPDTTVTPLVGREDDLELLRLIYRRAARERVPELVTIIGEAGIGKTRLACGADRGAGGGAGPAAGADRPQPALRPGHRASGRWQRSSATPPESRRKPRSARSRNRSARCSRGSGPMTPARSPPR